MVDVCTRASASGAVSWRDLAESWTIVLDPPATIDRAPLVADMNGDGHLDVLAERRRRTLRLVWRRPAPGTRHTLRAGRGRQGANGDPDAAGSRRPHGRWRGRLRVRGSFAALPPGAIGPVPAYTRGTSIAPRPGRWRVSRTSTATGSPMWLRLPASGWAPRSSTAVAPTCSPRSSIPTRQPVDMLEVGDFDGDLVDDLALVERALDPSEVDTVDYSLELPGPPGIPFAVARVRQDRTTEPVHVGEARLPDSSIHPERDGTKEGVLALRERRSGALRALPTRGDRRRRNRSPTRGAGVAAGASPAPGTGDVLAFAIDAATFDNHFWLLPAPLDPTNAAMRIGGTLDRRLRPFVASGLRLRSVVAAATADFDGDGRAEAVWAMPADEDQSCGLVFTAIRPDGVWAWRRVGPSSSTSGASDRSSRPGCGRRRRGGRCCC